MSERFRRPRFKVGDQVEVITLGTHKGKSGLVADVILPKAGDYVYRYRLTLTDGSSATLFGFELEAASPEGMAA